MAQHLAVTTFSESLRGIPVQQSLDEVLEFFATLDRALELQVLFEDVLLLHFKVWCVLEGMNSKGELPSNDAHSPPVCCEIVASIWHDFGRVVLWWTASRRCHWVLFETFDRSKINDLHVTLRVKHEIAQLDIAMHDVLLVQVADAFGNLHDQKLDLIFLKSLLYLNL